jgi:transcriptional regulator with XRE-family HTH domain
MSDFNEQLMAEFIDPDYRASYADSFLDAWIALQIRVIREQRKMTQQHLADALDTTQTAISRLESANYSGRSIKTLKAVAKALDCRLKVSFETYGSLIGEADTMSAELLRRSSFEDEFISLKDMPKTIGQMVEDREEANDVSLSAQSSGNVFPIQQPRQSRISELLQGRIHEQRHLRNVG